MKSIVPSKKPVLAKSRKQKSSSQLATSHDPAYIIQKVLSLSTRALHFIQSSPDNEVFKDVVLEVLLEDIEALAGKRSSDGCSLARGTAKDCTFANRVAAEMVNISSAADKCIELIDDMIVNKSFDLGLRAIMQCLKSINGSAFSLLRSAQDNFDSAYGLEDSSVDQG